VHIHDVFNNYIESIQAKSRIEHYIKISLKQTEILIDNTFHAV